MVEHKIQSLSERTVNTKFGAKQQWIVDNKWSSFKAEWNMGWKVGDMVKVVEAIREVNGKTYYNLECPPELKTQSGAMSNAQLAEVITMLKGINDKLDQIMDVVTPKSMPGIGSMPHHYNTTTTDVDLSNIPL